MKKLNDLKVRTQLNIGFAIILIAVGVLGFLALDYSTRLWLNTKGLYEHPLMVRAAVGDLKAEVLEISRDTRELCLSLGEKERLPLLTSIDASEVNAYRQFEILYKLYLGSRNDIDEAYTLFVQWKSIREETLRLLRAGKVSEATEHIKFTGIAGRHVDKLLKELNDINIYASARADKFFADAAGLYNLLEYRIMLAFGVIFLLCLLIGFLLFKGIKDPLKVLNEFSEQYRLGNLNARSSYMSANEFGVLSRSFNKLADTVKLELELKESAAKINAAMLRELEARAFRLQVLEPIMKFTGSQVGAIYVLNDEKTWYERIDSAGLGQTGMASLPAGSTEGELGLAIATKKTQRITKIPADTRFAFAGASGTFMPREIITVPLLSGSEVAAIISIASLNEYSQEAVKLVEGLRQSLSVWMNSMLSFRRIEALTADLEEQNRELSEQQKELMVQTDELNEQNTELEIQKQQLDEASRLKSAFLSNMSHELRTPLNSVIALSGVLNRRLEKMVPEEEHSYISIIERNGKHLLSLINDILDLSRIESGKVDFNLESFPLKSVTDEVMAMIEPQAREKNITLTSEVSPDLPGIASDYVKCRHIIQNLLSNAVKFTEKGSVKVSAAREGDFLSVSVSDTGIGIAPEHLSRIFDEFHQADQSTSRKYGGTGLGLAIAKKYSQMLSGVLSVKSELGKGSVFTLKLPLKLELPASGKTPERPQPDRRRVNSVAGKKILVVEDTEEVVIQMKDILVEQGYVISVARNGREALEMLKDSLPDAVTLDLMMPDMDGFQLLKSIRKMKNTSEIPVLILTAKHVTKEELSFLKSNHIHQLIQKGDVNRKELLSVVAKMVTSSNRPLSGPARKKAAGRKKSEKPLVLIVEDNPDNMLTAKALLQETCTVIEAGDGAQGVEKAAAHKPDLILMDISLPVLDGIEAFRRIRENESLCHIPVVALTASAMKGHREKILEYGFDGYVSKPIDELLLKKTIEDALNAG